MNLTSKIKSFQFDTYKVTAEDLNGNPTVIMYYIGGVGTQYEVLKDVLTYTPSGNFESSTRYYKNDFGVWILFNS